MDSREYEATMRRFDRERREKLNAHAAEMLRLEREYAAKLEEVTNVMNALVGDVVQAIHAFNTADSPFARRSLVRAIFAGIEGVLFLLRQRVLDNRDQLDLAEVAALEEAPPWRVNNRKASFGKPKYLTFEEGVRFTFGMIEKLTKKQRADFGGDGWKMLADSEKRRNEIMHPKSSHALDVSDEDIAVVMAGAAWFGFTIIELFRDWFELHAQERAVREAEQAADDAKREELQQKMAQAERDLVESEGETLILEAEFKDMRDLAVFRAGVEWGRNNPEDPGAT